MDGEKKQMCFWFAAAWDGWGEGPARDPKEGEDDGRRRESVGAPMIRDWDDAGLVPRGAPLISHARNF
jgi:hypothetical protein